MGTRSKATFQKRQKEMKRLEKQRMKADRRAQRSLAKQAGQQAASATDALPAEPELQGDSGPSEKVPARDL